MKAGLSFAFVKPSKAGHADKLAEVDCHAMDYGRVMSLWKR
jgi:hypothetical protein